MPLSRERWQWKGMPSRAEVRQWREEWLRTMVAAGLIGRGELAWWMKRYGYLVVSCEEAG